MTEYISVKGILDRVDEEQLYYHYLGIDVSKKKCRSIVRSNDSSSSMKFHKINGRVKWTDFGSKYSDCDIFDLLHITQGWSFYESLVRINNDFKLNFRYSDKYNIDILITNPVNTDRMLSLLKEQDKVDIQVVLNKFNNIPVFTKDDFKYWGQGYINKSILNREHVFSVSTVLINGSTVMKYHKKDPIYLYVYKYDKEKYYKIYRPLHEDKDGKWLSNLKDASKIIGGLLHLMEESYLIITKSKKDYMVLRWILGFNTVYIQSESTPIDEGIMNMLWNKYEVIYSLFDNDKAGYDLNYKFAETNDTIPIFYPEELGKDTWDVVISKGIEENKEIVNKLMI